MGGLEIIQQVLAFSENPLHTQLLPRLRATCTWAMLEAGLGDLESASSRLDRLAEEIETHANPVLSCMYHEVQARVALLQKDPQN